jgi:hypothetical protein
MTNKSRLVSGRVPTSNSANVSSDRYQFLDLSSAEPNLGTANAGYILSYNPAFPGGRNWIDPTSIASGNSQVALEAANAAYAFAQTAFSQANSANVLAQAAYNQANSAYNKANSANVLAQTAFDSSNTKFSSSGGNISGDVTIINNKNLTVSGNLIIQGNLVTTNVQSFTVADPLIVLGLGNYTSDLKDIGFASHYNNGTNAHTGLVRDYGTKEYIFFQGYTPELDANNELNIAHPSFATANAVATYFKGNLVGTTAVVNNIELGGFTAAAYNQANTAINNTILLSAVNVAQNANISIALAGVVAANANIIALQAGLNASNSNISFLTGFSQGAYDKANSAYNYANTLSGSISTFSQGAYDKANAANVLAQAAYNQANTASSNTIVLAAINVSQNANILIAQAGVAAANSNISYLINTFVPAAYNAANTAQLQALNAFGFAQASYNQANSAYGIALSAGIQANVANSIANTALQNTASIVTAGNLTVSNNLTVTNNVAATNIITNSVVINKVGGGISGANTISANTLNVLNAIVTSNTASSSNITGALLVTGGVGVQGNLYATAVYSNNQIVLTSEPIGQNAFNKANAANVLAQAAFDYANASSGGALAQAAFNKANVASITANGAVQTTGGTITGTLNVANIIETGKTITVGANTTFNTNPLLANSGIVVGALTYKSNSIYFDGAVDSLTLSPGITIGSNPYTVEFWMYLLDSNITTTLGVIGTNTTNAFNLRLNSNTEIQIDKSFASNQLFTIPTLQANTWYHVAAVRDVSNRETVFINGVRSSTGYVTDTTNFTGPTNTIAEDITTANYTPYLSNIRIVTNNNLYDPTQSSVTVPTGILGTVTGTKYLGAQYGASYDASGNQTITVNGAARAEFFSPFYNPPAISLLYDGANNWFTYGGITANNFYSNNINLLNYTQAAFDTANLVYSASGSGFTQAAFDKANAANVMAQSAYNQANTAGANTVVLKAINVSQNANISIALAGVAAANANIAIALAGLDAANANIVTAQAGVQAAIDNIVAILGVDVSQNARIDIALAGVAAANANIIALYAGNVAQNANISIAQAGVVAANANISFLTGFSQGAYDKANTTATVANSTAVVANIVAAGLIATNTNTAIALAGVAAANANISFLTGFSQGAYDKANVAQAGLIATNTNTAIALAGVAAANSNISFLTGFSQAAFNKANTANVKYTESNTYPVTANVGDQWYDSSTDILFEYVTANGSSFWIDQSSAAISTQAGYNVNVSGLPVRTTFSISTPSIANNTTANVAVNTYKTYVLSKVLTNAAAWVRIYTDGTSRTSDAGRSVGNDPLAGSGVVAEILNTTGTTQLITPGVIGFNNDATVNNNTYLAVTNLSGSTQVITVTMTMLQFE